MSLQPSSQRWDTARRWLESASDQKRCPAAATTAGQSHQKRRLTRYRDGDDGVDVDGLELDGLMEPPVPAPVVDAVFGLHLSLPVLTASQEAMVA
jgi:hypothetical protein